MLLFGNKLILDIPNMGTKYHQLRELLFMYIYELELDHGKIWNIQLDTYHKTN